jgi:hypothetical protein
MSTPQIQSFQPSKDSTVLASVDNAYEGFNALVDENKPFNVKTEDTPATSPETTHLTADLKLSLDPRAPVQNPYSSTNLMCD